jgi:hypothetical protein
MNLTKDIIIIDFAILRIINEFKTWNVISVY